MPLDELHFYLKLYKRHYEREKEQEQQARMQGTTMKQEGKPIGMVAPRAT